MTDLHIGDVATRTGLTAPTIRYYESVGLLPRALRSDAGYRHYSEAAVEELRFIKKAQALGFSLQEIGEILTLSRSGKAPCSHVLDLARRHLTAVEERILQLSQFRDRLAAEVDKWDGVKAPTCGGLCQIISGATEPANAPMQARLHNRGQRVERKRK